MLTHKRSTSECPRKGNFKKTVPSGITNCKNVLRSLNISRKSSCHSKERGEKETPQFVGKNSSQPNLTKNFILICG